MVFSLKRVREKYYRDKCSHRKLIVSDENSYVKCEECGEHLNPIWVLLRYEREESAFRRDRELYIKAVELYEKKKRTKCEHCHRMTKINIKHPFI